MTLDGSFQIASRLLALVGLLSLILTNEFSRMIGLVALAAVAVSFALVLSGVDFSLDRRIWTGLNLAVLAFFVVDIFFVSQSLLAASAHFVVFLSINKLFNLRTPRDHFQLYLISFLQLLAAATFTIDVTFLVSFVLYLLTATWALLLHHLVTETAAPTDPLSAEPAAGRSPGLTWPFFLATNGIAFFALGCTLLLFIIIPRVGLGYFHRSQSSLIRMSGFSEQVDLGEIGSVKRDSTIVMRIQPSRPLPSIEGIYWRGMVFDDYDGRTWRNSFGGGRLLSSEGSGVFNLGYRRYPERTITQEVILEPLDTVALFGAPNAIQVGGQFSRLRVNAMNSISLPMVPATRIDYILTSMLPVMTKPDTDAESITYPRSLYRRYLQLPEGSDGVRNLAREVLAQTPSARTVLQKIITLEKYLKANYRYTLDVQPAPDIRPIEDFLFRQKAGFCEHYATAMALMLRSIGIPTRFVTGFLPGEWNEVGKYYTVRQSNAHAWVEVWFPQSGWIPFDPTPTAPEEAVSFIGFLSWTLDSFQWQWNRYVIYFSVLDQIRLAREVKDGSLKFRAEMGNLFVEFFIVVKGWLNSWIPPWAAWGSVLLLAGVALFWVAPRFKRWLRGRSSFQWPGRSRKIRSVAFYFQMLDLFRSRGISKPDTLTPREFIRTIPAPQFPLRPTAAELTGLYYRVRFAGTSLSDQEQKRVAELLQDLRSGLSSMT
jgi:protein-glutamine gamma-glutamyltransferase